MASHLFGLHGKALLTSPETGATAVRGGGVNNGRALSAHLQETLCPLAPQRYQESGFHSARDEFPGEALPFGVPDKGSVKSEVFGSS